MHVQGRGEPESEKEREIGRERGRERNERRDRLKHNSDTYIIATFSTMTGNRKLVVLGIPWDVDTEGLRQYMCQFGDLEDVIVMKDRLSGRSRGFGYVTFSSYEGAEKAVASQHVLQGRILEVKIATPKDEMRPTSRKITRIFVARISPTVTDEIFRSYFEKYGSILDAYLPKDQTTKQHRGIGFVTYENAESVDKVMSESHELAGSTIAVDRANPKCDTLKEETGKVWERTFPGASGVFNSHVNTKDFGPFYVSAFGGCDFPGSDRAAIGNTYESNCGRTNPWSAGLPAPQVGGPLPGIPGIHPSAMNYGSTDPNFAPSRVGRKIFVGRIPVEATAEDLQLYFSQFGQILDVYLPKDAKKISHRGFGFVTFAEESTAEHVSQRRHEILGHLIAVDRASPLDETPSVGVYAPSGLGKKIFIGRIPVEATTEDLRLYFSQYGCILDVYLPKDAKKISHRGFGFVTFAEESTAEHVAQKTHDILGHRIAVDRAAPLDETRSGLKPSNALFGGAGGPLRGSSSTISGSAYGNTPANLGFNSSWTPYGGLGQMAASDGGPSGHRTSRMEPRYRPY